MFENRMNEKLVWIQLDLDTVNHNVSSRGLIIPICQQIENWCIDKLLDKYVRIKQKVYDFTPNQKITQVLASMMFGCEDNKRMNKVLKEDNSVNILYRWKLAVETYEYFRYDISLGVSFEK